MGLDKQEQRLSRFLSLVLRHKPEAAGITLDGEGWVRIGDLLEGCRKNGNPITIDQLSRIVQFNDKKRFTVDDKGRIRAAQGHSLESVKISYEPQVPPKLLYHGTATRFLEPIMLNGLRKMQRNHVHLSDNIETAKAVGARHGKCVVIPVRTEPMLLDGFDFYLSDNNVWLVDNVPPKYFEEFIYL